MKVGRIVMFGNVNSIIVCSKIGKTFTLIRAAGGVIHQVKEWMSYLFYSWDKGKGQFMEDRLGGDVLSVHMDGLVKQLDIRGFDNLE